MLDINRADILSYKHCIVIACCDLMCPSLLYVSFFSKILVTFCLMRVFWGPTDMRTKACRAPEKAPAVVLWLALEQTRLATVGPW